MIYLDNAASSFPKPYAVTAAIKKMLDENGANPGRSGHFLSAEAAKAIFSAREAAAAHFGVRTERTVITQNATHAINVAIKGLLKEGDHAIISDLEHNSVLRPLYALKEKGVSFSVAEVDADGEKTVKGFESAIRKETKMIFCTHASNVTGQMLPIEALADLCRKKGILFCLDASQSCGKHRFSLEKNGISLLCTAGHKGLYGPQGTGLLVLSGDVTPSALLQGGTGGDSLSMSHPTYLPEALESGTQSGPAAAGLFEGIRFADRFCEAIRERTDLLTRICKERLLSVKEAEIFGCGAGIVSFRLRNRSVEETSALLGEKGIFVRGGYHCSALAHKKLGTDKSGGLIRVSFGAFNTEEEAAHLEREIRFIANKT